MTTRLGTFALIAGLAAVGATCKGTEQHTERRAPDDSTTTAPVQRPPAVTEMEGVDLALVPPEARQEALRLLNEHFCYCGCPRTIASCLANRADCSCVKCSERMANFILAEYKDNTATEDIESQLLEGFSEGFNAKPIEVDPKNQPARGPADAKFTIMEFADFACSHCASAAVELDELLTRRKDVRLLYYYFPRAGLSSEASMRAAEAAEEARQQGKFWELAHLMFREQHALEAADVEKYAQDVGLEMARFRSAMETHKHRDVVMKNKALGESLGIRATPTLYVNGRPFGLGRTQENLEMRFAMESERGRCE